MSDPYAISCVCGHSVDQHLNGAGKCAGIAVARQGRWDLERCDCLAFREPDGRAFDTTDEQGDPLK